METKKPIDELCQCGHSKRCHGKTNLEDNGGRCNQCNCELYTWKEFIFFDYKISNEKFDKLGEEIDKHLLEEYEITIDGEKTLDFIHVILNALGLKKE